MSLCGEPAMSLDVAWWQRAVLDHVGGTRISWKQTEMTGVQIRPVEGTMEQGPDLVGKPYPKTEKRGPCSVWKGAVQTGGSSSRQEV